MKKLSFLLILSGLFLMVPGCKKTDSADPVVNDPYAMFKYTKKANGIVSFTNTSTDATSYLWDFGDGQTSTTAAETFEHQYPQNGTYKATLTAYGNGKSTGAYADLNITTAAIKQYKGANITLRWAVHVKHYDKNGNLLASNDENGNYETGSVTCTQNGNILTGSLKAPSSGSITVTINPNNTASFTFTNCTGNYWAGGLTINCSIKDVPFHVSKPEFGFDSWFTPDTYPYVQSFSEVYSSESDSYTFELFQDSELDGGSTVDLLY
ncbi:MAG: PKD domain-containing protein [Bacteroidota bacterium]